MQLSLPSLVYWTLISNTFIHSLEIQQMYVERTDNSHGQNVTVRDAISTIDCAGFCATSMVCRRFSFNNDKKKCHMSDDTLLASLTGGQTFGRYCPSHMDFKEAMIGPRKCCIKIQYTFMNQTDAQNMCKSEGAHLYTLEGQFDFDYILNERTKGLFFWIDGGQTLTTWNNEVIPWTSWLPGHPRVNECTMLSVMGSKMATTKCDMVPSVYTTCQIDL